MLNTFETWLAGSLRASLPESTKLVAGPMLPPAPADTPLLNLSVVKLRPLRKGTEQTLKTCVTRSTSRRP
jgi:hypothetical protein